MENISQECVIGGKKIVMVMEKHVQTLEHAALDSNVLTMGQDRWATIVVIDELLTKYLKIQINQELVWNG